ncbi:hypothetical protein GFS31_21930 [Leptolyngbya sp. BL0902]|nr:hypothetical protein GFS31_21930 [Leptolyngbya sp. BL0902]
MQSPAHGPLSFARGSPLVEMGRRSWGARQQDEAISILMVGQGTRDGLA